MDLVTASTHPTRTYNSARLSEQLSRPTSLGLGSSPSSIQDKSSPRLIKWQETLSLLPDFLIKKLIQQQPNWLQFIPEKEVEHFLTPQFCQKLANRKGELSWFISLPETHRTEALCAAVIERDLTFLPFVPEKHKGLFTEEFCLKILQNPSNLLLLEKLPSSVKTDNLKSSLLEFLYLN